MQPLNFPAIEARTRVAGGRIEIFDPLRRKFVALTPEEWVRQHVIGYLVNFLQVPAAVISVEKQVMLNRQPHRFDAVVFSRKARPLVLIECKAPGIAVNEQVFDQASRYNLELSAPFFLITNGLDHYTCRVDFENRKFVFLPDLPLYSAMLQHEQ